MELGEKVKVDEHLAQQDKHLGVVPLPVVEGRLAQVFLHLPRHRHLTGTSTPSQGHSVGCCVVGINGSYVESSFVLYFEESRVKKSRVICLWSISDCALVHSLAHPVWF